MLLGDRASVSLRGDGGSLDRSLELTRIARPWMRDETRNGGAREHRLALAHALPREQRGERLDVGDALSKRRDAKGEARRESHQLGLHIGLALLIQGDDEARSRFPEELRNLRLYRGEKPIDMMEEQRAVVGRLRDRCLERLWIDRLGA